MGARADSDKNIDRRKAFRCPVLGPERMASLVRSGVETPVELIDESATGFGIRMREDPQLEQGDVVQLRTSAGLHEASVTGITEEDAAKAGDVGDEGATRVFRVGLQRRGEIDVWAETGWREVLSRFRLTGPGIMAAACLLLVAAATVVAIVGVSRWVAAETKGWPATPRRNAETPSTLERILDARSAPGAKPSPAWTRGRPHGSKSADSRSSGAKSGVASGGSTGRVPEATSGAAVFARPEIAERLGLSATQTKAIHDIVAAAEEVRRQIQQSADPAEQARLETELLEHARTEALGVLTEQQRAAWESMPR